MQFHGICITEQRVTTVQRRLPTQVVCFFSDTSASTTSTIRINQRKCMHLTSFIAKALCTSPTRLLESNENVSAVVQA